MRDKILLIIGIIGITFGVVLFISGAIFSNSTIVWIGFGFESVGIILLGILACILMPSGTTADFHYELTDEDIQLIYLASVLQNMK